MSKSITKSELLNQLAEAGGEGVSKKQAAAMLDCLVALAYKRAKDGRHPAIFGA